MSEIISQRRSGVIVLSRADNDDYIGTYKVFYLSKYDVWEVITIDGVDLNMVFKNKDLDAEHAFYFQKDDDDTFYNIITFNKKYVGHVPNNKHKYKDDDGTILASNSFKTGIQNEVRTWEKFIIE